MTISAMVERQAENAQQLKHSEKLAKTLASLPQHTRSAMTCQ